MSRIVKVTAMIDSEHECELRVRDDIHGVTFELESWAGPERITERMVVEPSVATAFAKQIMLSARRTNSRQRAVGV